VARAAYISFQKRDIPRSERGIIGPVNFEIGKKIQGAQIRIANKPYICTAEMKNPAAFFSRKAPMEMIQNL